MLWDACQDYFRSKDGQREIRENVLEPIGNIMYNEMYFYVWLICLYHVFLIIIGCQFSIITTIIALYCNTSIHACHCKTYHVMEPHAYSTCSRGFRPISYKYSVQDFKLSHIVGKCTYVIPFFLQNSRTIGSSFG